MYVYEWATNPAVVCRPDTPIQSVARMMAEHDIGAVVVVDGQGRATGIATDRDLALRALVRGEPRFAPVRSVMTREVVVVSENADLEAAKTLMAAWGIRRLPVVDLNATVVGMISLDDLTLALAEDADRLARPARTDMHGRQRGIRRVVRHPSADLFALSEAEKPVPLSATPSPRRNST